MPQLAGFVEGVELSVLPTSAAAIGQQLIIGLDEDRRPALFNCDTEEACLVELPTSAAAAAAPSKAPPSLLQAALQCVLKERVSCYGQVTAVDGNTATVRLALVLPASIWTGQHRWAATPANAQLFIHLAALPLHRHQDEVGQQGGQQCQQHVSYWQRLQQQLGGVRPPPVGTDPFSLGACFQALPMRGEHTVVPPLVAADAAQPCHLAQLDQPLLLAVLRRLDRRSLVAAAASCRHLRELTRDVAPGLKLSLFPHQRIAVMWMQGREAASLAPAQQPAVEDGAGHAAPHPFVQPICCSELRTDDAAAAFGQPAGPGLPLWLDTASGAVLTEAPPALQGVRGGLFADEPGLGKTITALALILRTLGTLPAAPAGLEVTCTQPGRSYYSLPRETVASAAQMTRSRSSRASLRRTRSSGHAAIDPVIEEASAALAAAGRYFDAQDPDAIARHAKRQRRSASAEADGPSAVRAGAVEVAAACVAAAGAAAAGAAAPEPPADSVAGAADDKGGALQAETWVQCELCQKWRRLPAGHKAPSGDFVCTMNPDEALQWQGCAAPEEEWGGGEAGARVLFCPGWVEAGKPQGAEHNVALFRRLLQQQPDLAEYDSPLAWLACQQLDKLMRKPFTLERERCRRFPGFAAAFRQIELEPIAQQAQQAQQRSHSARRSGGRAGGHGAASSRGKGRGRGGGRGRGRGGGHSRKQHAWGTSSEDEEEQECSDRSGFSSDEDASEDWGARHTAGLQDSEGGSDNSDEEELASSDEGGPALCPQQRQQRGGRRRRGAGGSSAEATRWQRPATHAALVLDQLALRQALEEELAPPPHRIFLSQATLVVVPAALIDHWRTQIRLHVQAAAGQQSGLRVLVYTAEARDAARREEQELTPQQLAWEADLVLTTFDTMSSEWRAKQPIDCSPLMQVHWLRVILDEGHKVGSVAMTNKLQMAMCLHAERRWVMTGTPTPNTLDASVDKLQPLLAFLQHQPYGSEPDRWRRAVQTPFERREEVGRMRLLALLNDIMIRASKADLLNLGIPPLHFKETVLDFAPDHAASWNQFVDIVRFNLMTSDWYDESHRESLLNAANSKRAQQTLNNLRLSCNVAGNCMLQVLHNDVEETLQLLTMRQLADQGREVPCSPTSGAAGAARPSSTAAGAGPAHKQEQQAALAPLEQLLDAAGEDWKKGAEHIRTCLEEGGACSRCKAEVRVLCVAPCACLLCVDCASSQRTACPKCTTPYRMQPVDDPGRLADNPQPKWEVPLELIEWQPAYAQRGATGVQEGTWQPEWSATRSTKCVHLLRRLLEVGAAVPRGSGRHVSCKAIVYTQFWSHMMLLQAYLKSHGVRPAVLKGGMSSQSKSDALNLFRHSPHVGVLLMDESGQVGLDLSFASHVFLMEPIYSGADEEQVVSRAHRMGAKQPVQVEILAMRGTVEERMLLAQRRDGRRPATGAAAALPAAAAAAIAPGLTAGRLAKGDAVRREERNEYLSSLRPVPMLDLPVFEDLPGGEDEAAEPEGEEQRRAAAVVAAQLRQAEAEEEGEQQEDEAEAPEEPAEGQGSQTEERRSVAAAAAAAAAEEEEAEDGQQSSTAARTAATIASSKRPAPSPARARQPTWPEVAAGPGRRAAATAEPAASTRQLRAGAAAGSAALPAAAEAATASQTASRRSVRPRTVRFAADEEGEPVWRQQQVQQLQVPSSRPAEDSAAPVVKAPAVAQGLLAPPARLEQQAKQHPQPAECRQTASAAAAPPAIKQEPEQQHQQQQRSHQPAKRSAASDVAGKGEAGQAAVSEDGSSPAGDRPSKRRRAVRFADADPSADRQRGTPQDAKGPEQHSPPVPSRPSLNEQLQQQGQQQQQAVQEASRQAVPAILPPSAVSAGAPVALEQATVLTPTPMPAPAEPAVAAVPAAPAVAAIPAQLPAAPAAAVAPLLAPGAPAAGAPAQAAAPVQAASGPAPAGAAGAPVDEVIDLLDQAADSAEAQAAGLSNELAAAFGGAFFEMESMQQRRHAQRLVKLLQQGKHSMVAAHIRACLQRQGVLPVAGTNLRAQLPNEASAEGSGIG